MGRKWISIIFTLFLIGCENQKLEGLFLGEGGPSLPTTDVSSPNLLTLANLSVTNITTTSFDVQLDMSGDENANSTVALYYCNRTASPSCDPMAGFSVNMVCVGALCSYTLGGLAATGATYAIGISASDVDGVSGLPLSDSVSLPVGVLKIFRSVGYNNTSALAQGTTNGLTISSSVASFQTPLPDNVGIGDALQYDSDGNNSIDSVAFIFSRISSTQYVVSTAAGLTVPDLSTADQDWSLYRAYTSLKLAEDGTENTGLDDAIENFDTWSGGRDLVANTEQWNIVFYADAPEPGDNFVIDGWTTGTNEYLKFHVPSLTTEVGASQRHEGALDRSKALLTLTTDSAFEIGEDHVRVEGFQVFSSTINNFESGIEIGNPNTLGATAEVYIQDNIVIYSGVSYSGTQPAGVRGSTGNDAASRIYMSNNIISWANTNSDGSGFMIITGLAYLYNNTFLSSRFGVNIDGTATVVAKNNVVANSVSNGYRNNGGTFDPSSDNNLSWDSSSPGGANDLINAQVYFVNENIYDFRLDGSSYDAFGTGQDLSLDSVLPLSTDIRGLDRTRWDMGASFIPRALYRSVGSLNNAALVSGSGANTLRIALSTTGHTVATFSSALIDTVGVGDALQFDSTGDSNIDQVAFLSRRISSTEFIVKSASGTNAALVGTPTPSWDIFRAYDRLFRFVAGTENTGLDDTVENFDTWVNGKDLDVLGEQFKLALYADAPFGTRTRLISPWDGSRIHSVKIFAPYLPEHVGVSQKHEGVWDDSKVVVDLSAANNNTFGIEIPGVKVEGLQIAPSAGDFQDGIIITDEGDGVVIKNNLIRSTAAAPVNRSGIVINSGGGAKTETHIINNIIYGYTTATAINFQFNGDDVDSHYVYNNTVANSANGIIATAFNNGSLIWKNNIVMSADVNNADYAYNTVASEGNISGDATSPDGGGNQNLNVSFFAYELNDFRLSSADTAAFGVGSDLSFDPFYRVTDDARYTARNNWDRGALAYIDFGASLVDYDEEGAGTANDPYIIANVGQLEQVSTGCGAGNSATCNISIQIVENIDLTASPYTPIGDTTDRFTGSIHCGGRTLSNLTINTPGSSYVGFVGAMTGSSITECFMNNFNITGDGYVGGAVGDMGVGSTLDDVYVTSSTITGSSPYVGGVVGIGSTGATFTDVSFSGTLASGSTYAGGIIGYADAPTLYGGNVDGSVAGTNYVGGAFGAAPDATLGATRVTADITGNTYVGGIGGTLLGSGSNNIDLVNFKGSIVAFGSYSGGLFGQFSHTLRDSFSEGVVEGVSDVGGLVGQLVETDGGAETLTDVYSVADVMAQSSRAGGLVGSSDTEYSIVSSWAGGDIRAVGDDIGGLVGNNSAAISDSFAKGRVESSSGQNIGGLLEQHTNGQISRVNATGEVVRRGTAANSRVGGLVGYLSGGAGINNSYARGNVYSGGSEVGGFIGSADTTSQIVSLCHATGNVTSESSDVGGFIGSLDTVTIVSSYSLGIVSGTTNVGGFLGSATSATVSNSYTREAFVKGVDVGGFGGATTSVNLINNYSANELSGSTSEFGFVNSLSGGTINENYWNSDLAAVNGTSSAASVASSYEGRTSSQFIDDANFDNGQSGAWDYTSTWTQLDTRDYPIHRDSYEGQCVVNSTAATFDAIGSGTYSDPYIICNRTQFEDIGDSACDPFGATVGCGSFYVLGADIDLLNNNASSIGDFDTPFSGVFDGRFHKIKNYFMESTNFRRALFNYLSGSIRNLIIENNRSNLNYQTSTLVFALHGSGKIIDVYSQGEASGSFSVGGLVSLVLSNLYLERAMVYGGTFVGQLSGGRHAGGIIASSGAHVLKSSSYVNMDYTEYVVGGITSHGSETVKKVKSMGTLTGSASSYRMGGITGSAGDFNFEIRQAYSSMDISLGNQGVGGILGEGNISIYDSYSTNSVIDGQGTADDVGGLVGTDADIYTSYANNQVQNFSSLGGGVIGRDSNSNNLQDNFWNSQYLTDGSGPTSTGDSPGEYTGLSGAANLLQANYTNFDFTRTWIMEDTLRPPMLRWMLHPVCHANTAAVSYNDIGSGTQSDPYKICFIEQLVDLSANGCDSDSSAGCASHYMLMNDLDAKGASIAPIGDVANSFTGSFNGQNYVVANVVISSPATDYIGLFGHNSGRIENIKLHLVDITGNQYVGGLAGYNSGTIKNTKIHGVVSSEGGHVGGLVGRTIGQIYDSYVAVDVTTKAAYGGGLAGALETGTIERSAASGTVISDVAGAGIAVEIGGFVGRIESGGTVRDSSANGDVDGNEDGYVGGFVGYMLTSGFVERSHAHGDVFSDLGRAGGFVGLLQVGTIQNSFSDGDVTSASGVVGNYYGGFAGRANDAAATITHCYNRAQSVLNTATDWHPFAAQAGAAALTNNYYDADLGGVDDPGRMTPLADSNFDDEPFFVGWDFVNTWRDSSLPPVLIEAR